MSSIRIMAVGVSSLAVFFGGMAVSRGMGQGIWSGGARKPFTATIHVQSPGGPIEDTVVYAVRADGSVANSVSRSIRNPAFSKRIEKMEFRTIYDTVGKMQTTLYPGFRGKTSVPLSDAAVLSLRSRPLSGCAGSPISSPSSPAGPDTILGFRVVRTVTTGGDGVQEDSYRLVEYRAPGLDCFSLRTVLEARNAQGAYVVRQVKEAQEVFLGSPHADLFEVPQGYSEMPPSQALEEDSRMRGIPASACARDTGKRADARYFEQRADIGVK